MQGHPVQVHNSCRKEEAPWFIWKLLSMAGIQIIIRCTILPTVYTQMHHQKVIASKVFCTYDLYKPLNVACFFMPLHEEQHCFPPLFTLHRVHHSTRAYLDSKVSTLIGFFFIQKGLDSMPCMLSIHLSKRAH